MSTLRYVSCHQTTLSPVVWRQTILGGGGGGGGGGQLLGSYCKAGGNLFVHYREVVLPLEHALTQQEVHIIERLSSLWLTQQEVHIIERLSHALTQQEVHIIERLSSLWSMH